MFLPTRTLRGVLCVVASVVVLVVLAAAVANRQAGADDAAATSPARSKSDRSGEAMPVGDSDDAMPAGEMDAMPEPPPVDDGSAYGADWREDERDDDA